MPVVKMLFFVVFLLSLAIYIGASLVLATGIIYDIVLRCYGQWYALASACAFPVALIAILLATLKIATKPKNIAASASASFVQTFGLKVAALAFMLQFLKAMVIRKRK